ncbi:MAG: hypothetical protein RIR18_2118 [Pseudomonadota bacterium]
MANRLSTGFWIRLIFTLSFLGWLGSRIDWNNVSEGLKSAQPLWFLLGATLLMLSSVLAGLRWAVLMKKAGFRQTPMLRWQGLYFAGSLLNQGLPTVMGGDSFRAWQAARPHKAAALVTSPDAPGLRLALGTVVLDRTLGLMGNLMLGCLGLISLGGGLLDIPADALADPTQASLRNLLFADSTAQLGAILFSLMLAGLALFSALLCWPALGQKLSQLLQKQRMAGLLPTVELAYGFRWLIPQILLALSIHALGVAAMAACLYGVGITPPLSALMVTLPAIGILLLLPISISGWGLRESALAAVLSIWGVPAGLTVLASLAFGLMTLLAALPGLPALISHQPTPQNTP